MAKDINVFGKKPAIPTYANRQMLSPVDVMNLPDGSIPQEKIEAWIIFSGTAAKRPDGSTHVKAYFSTDENKLYIYNGGWVSTTLS